jgi:hypothetical protein
MARLSLRRFRLGTRWTKFGLQLFALHSYADDGEKSGRREKWETVFKTVAFVRSAILPARA